MLENQKNLEELYISIPAKCKEDFDKLEPRFKNRVCMFWLYARKQFEEENCHRLRMEIQACLYAQKALEFVLPRYITEKVIVDIDNLDGDYKHEGGTPSKFALAIIINLLTGNESALLEIPAHGDLEGKIWEPLSKARLFREEYGL